MGGGYPNVLCCFGVCVCVQGDLAKKKIYPTLWYCPSPPVFHIVLCYHYHSLSLSLSLSLTLTLTLSHSHSVSLSYTHTHHTHSLSLFHTHSLSLSLNRRVAKGGLFPKNTKIVGYARSDLTIEKLKEKCTPFLKVLIENLTKSKLHYHAATHTHTLQAKEEDGAKLDDFWAMNSYVRGSYTEKVTIFSHHFSTKFCHNSILLLHSAAIGDLF